MWQILTACQTRQLVRPAESLSSTRADETHEQSDMIHHKPRTGFDDVSVLPPPRLPRVSTMRLATPAAGCSIDLLIPRKERLEVLVAASRLTARSPRVDHHCCMSIRPPSPPVPPRPSPKALLSDPTAHPPRVLDLASPHHACWDPGRSQGIAGMSQTHIPCMLLMVRSDREGGVVWTRQVLDVAAPYVW